MALTLVKNETHTPTPNLKNRDGHRKAFQKHITIGQALELVDGTSAVVVGYNIAGYGMYFGGAYPLVVQLSDGTTRRIRIDDVQATEQ